MRKALLLCTVFALAYFCPAQKAQSGLHGVALTLQLPIQTEASRTHTRSPRADECAYAYPNPVLYQGATGPACDTHLKYSPLDAATSINTFNLESRGIEGFYFADGWPTSKEYPNSLLYLFASPESPVHHHGGTVVANPLYANADTIGTLTSINGNYILPIYTPMPNYASQLDYRYGHVGQVIHNWSLDPYTETPDAVNTVCLADMYMSDTGTKTSLPSLNCGQSAYISSVPGWNARTAGGDTMITNNRQLSEGNWSAGGKSVIDMPVYFGGVGDTELIDSDGTYKPGWTGLSDEGFKLIRLGGKETAMYTGTVVASGYQPIPLGDSATYAGTTLTIRPGSENLQVGVGHPMLDMSSSFTSKKGSITGGAGAATLSDPAGAKSSAGWGSLGDSGSCSVGNLPPSPPADVTVDRLPNSGLATLIPNPPGIPLYNCTQIPQVGQIIGLCGIGAAQTEETGKCQINYEQAAIQSVAGFPETCTSPCSGTITAYIRYSHPQGSGANFGGLVGSFISFNDYTNSIEGNTLKDVSRMYVQNVFSNTTTSLLFGIMQAGSLTNYAPKQLTGEPGVPYTIWRGGTVYDVRDNPDLSAPDVINPCRTASVESNPMINAVDGCFFVMEDSNTAYPFPAKGGAWSGSVAQTNYAAANWYGLYLDEAITNPYASYTGLDVKLPLSTGVGVSGSTGLLVGGIGAGQAIDDPGLATTLSLQQNLSTSGLYVGPTLINGNGYFGEGWHMYSTPYGALNNHPDLIEIANWTQCPAGSFTGLCTEAGLSGNYYQQFFVVLDLAGTKISGTDIQIGYPQTQTAYRNGKYTFDNYGTTFNSSSTTNAAVTVTSIETNAAANVKTDLAGEISLACAGSGAPCTMNSNPFRITYSLPPVCILQPLFDTTDIGPPWPTITATALSINFSPTVSGTYNVNYICIARN